MNIATGCLSLLGFFLLTVGVTSKFMGISLLEPFITSSIGYFIAANSCFLLVIIVDRFGKE